ncbi:hypothetical protein, partial [Agrobacterium deltaense]|uniref:hypothetical protein n=1 Tax=Agrobacterium deltaense TaxID=1183412 RepID=UPI001C6E8388
GLLLFQIATESGSSGEDIFAFIGHRQNPFLAMYRIHGRSSNVAAIRLEISPVLQHNPALSFIASTLPQRDTERRKSAAIELRRAHLRVATQLSAPPAWRLAGKAETGSRQRVGDLPFEHEASFAGEWP